MDEFQANEVPLVAQQDVLSTLWEIGLTLKINIFMDLIIPFRREIITPLLPLMVWPHCSFAIPFNIPLHIWSEILSDRNKSIYLILVGNDKKIHIMINNVSLEVFNSHSLNISQHCIPFANNLIILNENNDNLLEISFQIELKVNLELEKAIHLIPQDLNLDFMSLSCSDGKLPIVFDIKCSICPISLTPIKVGVKGKDCKHSQIMDAESFLRMATSLNSWKCPICFQHLPPEDLIKP